MGLAAMLHAPSLSLARLPAPEKNPALPLDPVVLWTFRGRQAGKAPLFIQLGTGKPCSANRRAEGLLILFAVVWDLETGFGVGGDAR